MPIQPQGREELQQCCVKDATSLSIQEQQVHWVGKFCFNCLPHALPNFPGPEVGCCKSACELVEVTQELLELWFLIVIGAHLKSQTSIGLVRGDKFDDCADSIFVAQLDGMFGCTHEFNLQM